MEVEEREREGTGKCYLHSTKSDPCAVYLACTRRSSIQNETRRESEKGETAKRIPIVKLNACTDNDQSNSRESEERAMRRLRARE